MQKKFSAAKVLKQALQIGGRECRGASAAAPLFSGFPAAKGT